MTVFGVALAVLAAAGFAAAARLQHHAVRDRGPRLRALARDRRWLAGLGCLGAASAVHAVALALAPLALVQPLGVLALVGSTAFAIRSAGRPARAAELLGVGMVVGGVAGFVLLAAPGAHAAAPGVLDAGMAAALVTAGAAALVVWGLASRGIGRCLGFAGAGACCYALVSVLTRVAAVAVREASFAWWLVPAVACAVLAAAAGGWLIQHAYAAGPPELVLACQTVGDPAAAVALGLTVLGESVALQGIALAAGLACAAIAVAGIAVLARDHTGISTHIEQSTTNEPRRGGHHAVLVSDSTAA